MNDSPNKDIEDNQDSLNGSSGIKNFDAKNEDISIEKIFESASHLFKRYQQQFAQTLEIAQIEARLSLKSLFYTFILMTCFAMCLVVSWIALNTMLGFWFYSLGLSLWLIIPGLFSLQIILLVALWKGIKHLTSCIGFSNTLKASKNS